MSRTRAVLASSHAVAPVSISGAAMFMNRTPCCRGGRAAGCAGRSPRYRLDEPVVEQTVQGRAVLHQARTDHEVGDLPGLGVQVRGGGAGGEGGEVLLAGGGGWVRRGVSRS